MNQTVTPTLHTATPAVDRAIDKIADTAASVPLAVERAAERATEVARQGTQKLQQGTQQVKAQLNQVSDSAIAYVKEEPVRALLIAAAAGAALMALAGLLGRSRH
jgi:ElaB/YqjD/DUF883 family membrane-anchored ribosome-binding protein